MINKKRKIDKRIWLKNQVLTKDSVTVSVDAVVYYRVNNATISITNVENAHHSTKLLAQTTLRNTMGTRPLHEILSERETISGNMQVNWYQFEIKRNTDSMFYLKSSGLFRWSYRYMGYKSGTSRNVSIHFQRNKIAS